MDVAYDHIVKESLPQDPKTPNNEPASSSSSTDTDGKPSETTASPPKQTLNAEFQEAYRSISSTPWGAKLGGFFSTVQKQGTQLYDDARQEATAASGEAMKGWQDLRASLASRARSLSTGEERPTTAIDTSKQDPGDETAKEGSAGKELEKGEDGEGMVSRFRSEAAKRLKELEKAEEAADAAILRFGSNLGNFLKEAVTVAPPSEEGGRGSKILFESKTEDGKRVIHSTRLEAQLHAIHTSSGKFLEDPQFEDEEKKKEWGKWKEDFDVEKRTQDIAKDLDRFEELRRQMEKIVPEKVEYGTFWCRYYFLRDLVEKEEQRRKEVLKGAAQGQDDEVAWDDDSDDDDHQSPTPQNKSANPIPGSASPASLATIHPTEKRDQLKPGEGRRSQDEKSQADSDASYDLVSGATSKTPGSPKAKTGDDDEEEDWE